MTAYFRILKTLTILNIYFLFLITTYFMILKILTILNIYFLFLITTYFMILKTLTALHIYFFIDYMSYSDLLSFFNEFGLVLFLILASFIFIKKISIHKTSALSKNVVSNKTSRLSFSNILTFFKKLLK